MNRTTGILMLMAILALLGAVVHAVWWKPGKPEWNGVANLRAGHPASDHSGKSKSRAGPNREEPGESLDPLKEIEEFDIRFAELREADGEAWVLGIQKLAVIANRLSRQGEFRSSVASALMVGRISEMATARTMSGEISPDDALRGLDGFVYIIPNDQQLIMTRGQTNHHADAGACG